MERPPVIHLLADFPASAPENTVYSSKIRQQFQGSDLVISNQKYTPGDVIAPSVFLRTVIHGFPENSMHFCCLHIEQKQAEKYLAAQWNKQWYFGPDNGLFPMTFVENAEFFKLRTPQLSDDILLDIYMPVAQQILSGIDLEVESNPIKLITPVPPVSADSVRLTVMYVDSMGNAYFNITRSEFDAFTQGRPFNLKLSFRDSIHTISDGYNAVPMGQKLALFGWGDFLQVAINCGSAEQYLGLVRYKEVLLSIEGL